MKVGDKVRSISVETNTAGCVGTITKVFSSDFPYPYLVDFDVSLSPYMESLLESDEEAANEWLMLEDELEVVEPSLVIGME